jgi:hypothetical protein
MTPDAVIEEVKLSARSRRRWISLWFEMEGEEDPGR